MIIILVGMRVSSKVEAAWGDSIWMLDAAARSPAFCRDTDNMQPISKQPVQPNSEQSVVVVVVYLSRHAFDYSIRAAYVGRSDSCVWRAQEFPMRQIVSVSSLSSE